MPIHPTQKGSVVVAVLIGSILAVSAIVHVYPTMYADKIAEKRKEDKIDEMNERIRKARQRMQEGKG